MWVFLYRFGQKLIVFLPEYGLLAIDLDENFVLKSGTTFKYVQILVIFYILFHQLNFSRYSKGKQPRCSLTKRPKKEGFGKSSSTEISFTVLLVCVRRWAIMLTT